MWLFTYGGDYFKECIQFIKQTPVLQKPKKKNKKKWPRVAHVGPLLAYKLICTGGENKWAFVKKKKKTDKKPLP